MNPLNTNTGINRISSIEKWIEKSSINNSLKSLIKHSTVLVAGEYGKVNREYMLNGIEAVSNNNQHRRL